MPALHFLLPITRLVSAPYSYVLGGLLIAAGLATGGTAFVSFTKAGTPVVPFERSTTLVTGGSYRFTRNPMYLGMVLMLSGVAALARTLEPVARRSVFRRHHSNEVHPGRRALPGRDLR